MKNAAVVLFSGGQDSTVCLAWALNRFDHVETIGFDYGQRHSVELECRLAVLREMKVQFPTRAKRLGADHLLHLDVLGEVSQTALTRDVAIEMSDNGLPNTFVPGRNLLFFTLAASLAYRLGIENIVGGMCEVDFSGYPDCRNNTLKALEVAINLGMDRRFEIHTPLMDIDKAATWNLAQQLGGSDFVEMIIEHTHSCYVGDRSKRHDWGYGCGDCPACELRREGYLKFKSSDVYA